MKQKLLFLALICMSLLSCHNKIWDELDKLDQRVSYLENLCKEMNTNIASYAGSARRQIVLIPTAATAGEEVRVEGLDPAEETTIMVYSSTGQLIDKLTTSEEATVFLTAPIAAGCYQVRVHSDSVDQTLRYIVNVK